MQNQMVSGDVQEMIEAVRGAELSDLRKMEERFWKVSAAQNRDLQSRFRTLTEGRLHDLSAEERATYRIAARWYQQGIVADRAERLLKSEDAGEELSAMRAELAEAWEDGRRAGGQIGGTAARVEWEKLWDRLRQQADYALLATMSGELISEPETESLLAVWS